MNQAGTAHEITITRVYPAPRELVWKAWTDPVHLAQWWGARGWSTPVESIAVDLRPGGVLRLTSVSDDDGSEMTTHGVFREVTEPERLVFEEPAEDAWHDGAVSTLTLTDLGDGRTEVVLRATIHTSDEMLVRAEAGMASALDRLGEVLR